jgi:hypothetical protein
VFAVRAGAVAQRLVNLFGKFGRGGVATITVLAWVVATTGGRCPANGSLHCAMQRR